MLFRISFVVLYILLVLLVGLPWAHGPFFMMDYEVDLDLVWLSICSDGLEISVGGIWMVSGCDLCVVVEVAKNMSRVLLASRRVEHSKEL